MATRENEPTTVSVTWEDQKKICTFGRLYQRQKDLNEDEGILKQRLEHISDAETEIYIADDIKYVMGEAFVKMDTDEVDTLLGETKEATQAQLDVVNEEREAIQEVVKRLKGELYAKFGNAIYLETDAEE
eukprot:TRINITY_DN40511_c0_g1_i1.p2 TRINITY_DN40511_c0_g1~~TRINITY_DN40511_c0_g1_i1.p2  ORF type:complete len:130 (+),score=55.87 TRINITY_DN40511_c0_g1_i1:52-441(+)